MYILQNFLLLRFFFTTLPDSNSFRYVKFFSYTNVYHWTCTNLFSLCKNIFYIQGLFEFLSLYFCWSSFFFLDYYDIYCTFGMRHEFLNSFVIYVIIILKCGIRFSIEMTRLNLHNNWNVEDAINQMINVPQSNWTCEVCANSARKIYFRVILLFTCPCGC